MGVVAKPVTPLWAARLTWLGAWLTLGCYAVLSSTTTAPSPPLLGKRAEQPLLPPVEVSPRSPTKLSWWPTLPVVAEVKEASLSIRREKRVPAVARVKPVPAESLPDAEQVMQVLSSGTGVIDLPAVEELVAEGGVGAEMDPRAKALADLEAAGSWREDTRLTVVALFVSCPSKLGLCVVEEARILQSPSPDVSALLRSYGQGARINLAAEDRAKVTETGGSWVLRSFRLASSEELLP